MKIIVIGATGMIGARVVSEATSRGHEVTGVSRSGGDGLEQADALQTDHIAELIVGHDAVVVAIAPPRDGSEPTGPLLAAGTSILDATRTAGVQRVVIVGGAGSLLLPDGSSLVDAPDFPDLHRSEALAQGRLLDVIRSSAADLEWTYISPAALIEPGDRTGNYQVGGDQLLVGTDGSSYVTADDFAAGLVDQLDDASNVHRRITIAAR